jgi:hypothetical protein
MADQSHGAAKPARGRPFPPGTSGNPGGRPKSALKIQELASRFSGEAIEVLAQVMREGTERARVMAASALLDRAHGKPGMLDVRAAISAEYDRTITALTRSLQRDVLEQVLSVMAGEDHSDIEATDDDHGNQSELELSDNE